MPRINPDDLGDVELARIFIAATMVEARRAEEVLTATAIRYAVVAEPLGRTLFGSPRNAAVFYVVAEDADHSAAALVAAGMEMGVVRDG
jgi:hypothetical protein